MLPSSTRRSFLGSILALGAAPAIVRADALMRVVPRETLVAPSGDVFTLDTLRLARERLDDAGFIYWDPAAGHSLTRIALCTSDGGVRVLDLAWGKSQRLAVASLPIDADSPLRPPRGVAFNRL
jgi:hypothetical protein